MTGPKLTTEDAHKVALSKTAPKVTRDSIEARIKDCQYMSTGVTTICVMTMVTDFKVIGHATPASALNYDKDVGQRYAYDSCIMQLWQLEGYLLREKLHQETQAALGG